MSSVSWRMPAKINLSLAVAPPRPDGYHDLVTVFHGISVTDEITASESDGGEPTLTVTAGHPVVDVAAIPLDASNLAVRAVHALATVLDRSPSVSLHLNKSIPVAGGLAGGSADAAGALLACNDLWAAGLSVAELRHLAADLGSDVPFAVTGGTAVGTGRGDVIDPVAVSATLHWVIVASDHGLSTPAVYRRLDEMRADGRTPAPAADVLGSARQLRRALADGDVEAVASALANDMEAAAVDLAPDLAGTVADGRAAGALAGMVSGSGPTCVFLAANADEARRIAEDLERDGYRGRVIVATGPQSPHRLP